MNEFVLSTSKRVPQIDIISLLLILSTNQQTCRRMMRKMLQSRFNDDLQTLPGYDLDSKSLQVSPAMFAPNKLRSCNPGWSLGCVGGGFTAQDISLDANTVEL